MELLNLEKNNDPPLVENKGASLKAHKLRNEI
jgi:hypothetical protein